MARLYNIGRLLLGHLLPSLIKGLKTNITMTAWEIWKERKNEWIHAHAEDDESKNWILTGAKHLAKITT